MNAKEVLAELSVLDGYGGILIPEFTWGDCRIDAIVINTRRRTIRGFEIKVTRADYIGDKKWQKYSEFCSTLAIACPEGLIKHEEVLNPFGLLYVTTGYRRVEWIKRPIDLQDGGHSLAWLYTYVKVLELEFARMKYDMV